MRYNNGFPVKIMSWAHLNGSGVVVGKHIKASSFADLGGLQIAVPYWYSMHNIVLQMGLKHAGLKPVIKAQGEPIAADEVNLQIMPPPDMPQLWQLKRLTRLSSLNHLTQPASSLLVGKCFDSRATYGVTTHAAWCA